MNEELWKDLSEDELQEARQRLTEIEQDILAKRNAARQTELNAQFNHAMSALMNRTGGRPNPRERQEVKQRFVSMGLTDFTARMVNDGQ